jgi:hypothetical protein
MWVTKLRINHLTNPISRAFDPPCAFWVTQSPTAKKQSAVQVIVLKGPSPDSATPIFDSGRSTDISSLGYALPIAIEPYSRYN